MITKNVGFVVRYKGKRGKMDLNAVDYGTENFENIVFVDIDGVFNYMNMKCEYRFLQESVDAINELYDTHRIQLVLSSSWKNAYSFLFMQTLFKDNGIKAPLIDKTFTYFQNMENNNNFSLEDLEGNELDVHYAREYEIYSWLKVFKPKHFLILDDYEMKKFNLREHQILTSYFGNNNEELAFRRKHLNEGRKILEKEGYVYV